jgi:asparagine synthase (glutamine-hydrolysing)
MCGIVGIVHRDERPVDPHVISTMCNAIRHRGPDDEGAWFDDRAALAMRRLSIIDLSGGHQPITNEDGSSVIVFNGEIYNYRALRSSLESRGHTLRTSGDTETIVHLYEDHGPAAVERLRGMFAFAIWDTNKRSLLLARDRFGIKPLYYVEADWGIAFASELKALVAAGVTERTLDWHALDSYLQLGYIPAPSSPFRDVRKLEPGHWLRWSPTGAIEMRRYWDLPLAPTAASKHVEQDVVEWLDESVTAHMVSDVPVAAFLSGGLDSGGVVASMARSENGTPPHAFTARYLGSGAAATDETELAASLAKKYGVELSVVDIAPQVADLIEPIVTALDEPHADDSALPSWILSKAAAESYKVVLTGIGGDELFAGYRRHMGLPRAERAARLPHRLRAAAARAAWRLPDNAVPGMSMDRAKRFLAATAGSADSADLYLGIVSRMSALERTALYAPGLGHVAEGEAARARFRWLSAMAGSPTGVTAALYLDYHTFLADDVLALSDRISMAHGLEVRVPFVDHEFVGRAFPLPTSLKVGTGAPKRLLRRALASRLTLGHLNAPKRGFVGPTASWLRNELRPMIEDELSPDRMRRLGYFKPETVTGLLDEHFSGRHNRETALWGLLCFSVWHRVVAERAPARRYDPAPARIAIPA